MANYMSSEVSRRFAALVGTARGLAASYGELAMRCRDDLTAYEAQLTALPAELAAAHLPTMERPDLERAERLTGFRGFSRRVPHAALQVAPNDDEQCTERYVWNLSWDRE